MKHIIKLQEFFDLTGIDYKENLWSEVYYPYDEVTIDDIIYNLPKKYNNVTKEQLQQLPALTSALEIMMNRIGETALIDECYKKQMDAVSTFADDLVKNSNNLYKGCYVDKNSKDIELPLNHIVIDWKKDRVIVDYNVKATLFWIKEIINGEGLFVYNTAEELSRVYDGSKNDKRAIEQHMNYLLNVKLIGDIWGDHIATFSWDCEYGDITDELAEDMMADNCNEDLSPIQLQFLEGKFDFEVMFAIEKIEEERECNEALKNIKPEIFSQAIKVLSTKETVWCGVCGKDVTKEYNRGKFPFSDTPDNACKACRDARLKK